MDAFAKLRLNKHTHTEGSQASESLRPKTETDFKYFQTNMMKLPRPLLGSAALCLALTASAAPTDPLETGFLNPPDSAKPQTWWHWMNGNITKEGITADLEAMKQIGLGGATIVNVDCDIPRGPVAFHESGMAGGFQIRRAGGEPARPRTLRGKLRRLVQQRRSVEHRDQRDAAPHLQRNARARPDVFNAVLPQPPTTLGLLPRHRRARLQGSCGRGGRRCQLGDCRRQSWKFKTCRLRR